MTAQEKIIALARAEIGYQEKTSSADLDSKTGNPGSRNFTKFARDLDRIAGYYNGKKQGVAWCDVFVDALFVYAFGPDVGRRMLYQPLKSCGAGCKYSRGYYKSKKRLFDVPEPGDQIFFWPVPKVNNTSIQHTGLVVAVEGGYVHTVEGNVANAVRAKKYRLNDPVIAGYGRPNWGLVAADFPDLKQYTVTVPGLTQAQADGLLAAWPRATKAVG